MTCTHNGPWLNAFLLLLQNLHPTSKTPVVSIDHNTKNTHEAGTPAVFLLLIYKSSACVVEQGLHGRVASLAPSSVSSLGQ